MHIFPYSIRPGTPAAKMEQVPKAVKEERAARAAEAAGELNRAYLAGCVGETYPVLYEQEAEGLWTGHAPNYILVGAAGKTCTTRCGGPGSPAYRGICWWGNWRRTCTISSPTSPG